MCFRSLLLSCLLLPPLIQAQTWEPVGGGFNSDIYSLEAYDGMLHAGGTFTQIGDLNAQYIARWDGTSWSSFGGLISFMAGNAFFAHDDLLYVGDLGRLRHWDGTSWHTYPGSFNSNVWGIGNWGDTIYAGGPFSHESGSPIGYIAQWDESGWLDLAGGVNAQVTEIADLGDKLFVGGNFTLAGGTPMNRTALWNGSTWEPMDTGVNDDVYAHCIFQDTLYIGGRFTTASGQTASRVAKWNGSQWLSVGGPLNDIVITMEVYGDQLYIGGAFTTPSRIARLAGNSWVPVGGGMDNTVRSMAVLNNTLFVAGSFTTAGGSPIERIAKWHLPSAPVAAFEASGNMICAGECVTFTDLSPNGPQLWAWSFPGGDPATSTEADPVVCYAAPGTYDVSLTVTNAGGSDMVTLNDAINVEVCTGIGGPGHDAGFALYPNPTHDRITLQRPDGGPLGSVRIHDLAGRVVLEKTVALSIATLDISSLNPGMYQMWIEKDGTMESQALQVLDR